MSLFLTLTAAVDLATFASADFAVAVAVVIGFVSDLFPTSLTRVVRFHSELP